MTVAVFFPLEFRTTSEWLTHLRSQMPNENIALVSELDATERAQVTIAVVRGVDPFHDGERSVDLAEFPRLQFIQCLWAGVERLLIDPNVPAGIPLARMIDPTMTAMMTASAVGHVLDVHCHHDSYRAAQLLQVWDESGPIAAPADTTVAVLGFGELGRATSHALSNLGFSVVALRTSGASGASGASEELQSISANLTVTTSLATAVETADIVINLLPLTPATEGLFDQTLLSRLKQGAAFINLARGAHVHEVDLLRCLDSGHLSRAILDVFTYEPLKQDHRFWTHPKVTVTPHVAAATHPRSASVVVAANVQAWRAQTPVIGLVDRSKGY